VIVNATPKNEPWRIRPIAPGDRDGLRGFYADLSPDSLEARFHGATPGIGDGTARFFCGPDHEHREGFVAEIADADGQSVIVGHACLEPISARQAEMAIAVADRWQHHGLGRAMLSRAITWARDHGLTELSASIRSSNGAMIGLVRSMGMPVTVDDGDGGVIDAIIELGVPLPHAA
jgi:GNAT superfamily N-acetyltransferase